MTYVRALKIERIIVRIPIPLSFGTIKKSSGAGNLVPQMITSSSHRNSEEKSALEYLGSNLNS